MNLLGVLAIIFVSSLNWRRSVKAVFFILVIDGALRKWVLPDASNILYFLKDFVLLGAYIRYYGFSGARKLSIKNDIITIQILIVAVWCIFQAFNPSLGSPFVGLFGLRGYLFYIPLIWMLPTLFQSEEALYKFLRTHLLLIIPVGLLGIAQFFSPASSPLNVYVRGDVTDIARFGATSAVRITGTFSYIHGYALYLIVCFGLLIPFLSLNQSRFWKFASIVEIFLVTINSFMTGSRVVVFAAGLFLLGYLGVRGFSQPTKNLRLLQQFLLPALVIVIAVFIWFKPAIDAFWLRTTSSHDVSGRIVNSFSEPFAFIKYKELDGYGPGATHSASQALRKALNLPPGEFIPTTYEEEPGRVALELGPIGFVLWYGLRISLLLALWFIFWKLKRPFLRQLALSAFLLQAIQINNQLVFHHTFSIYYWFFTSLIFILPRLEQIETWHQEQLLSNNTSYVYLVNSQKQ